MSQPSKKFYSVETKNAFSALVDSEDEMIKPVSELIVAERQAAQASADQILAASQPKQPRAQSKNTDKPAPASGDRRPRRTAENSTERRGPRTPRGNEEGEGAEKPSRVSRRPKLEGTADRTVKDQRMDRHSGTGRGKEMKKLGGGAHNWGNQPTDFGAEEGAANAEEGEESPIVRDREVADSGPKVMSLDEYKAAQEVNKVQLGHVEVKDDEATKRMMKGYVELKRDEEEVHGEEKKRDRSEQQAAKRQPVTDLRFRFAGDRDRRPGREDRAPRDNAPHTPKSGDEGSSKANARAAPGPDLSDNQAFPTLQAH